MKKLVLSLLIAVTIVLIPNVSKSKDNGPETLVLTQDNLLVLNSEVNGESVGELITKAKELDAKASAKWGNEKKPFYLYLNTPGGSVISGLELVEVLKGLGRPVHTITAFAASMGFQICENLDDRYILQSGILMSHRAAGGFQGSFGGTSPSQLDSRIHLFVQMTKELDEVTVKRTKGKQTLESYQKAYDSELWMTAQESISGGYADSIVRIKCDKSISGTTSHEASFLGIPITYELSNCPINTAPLKVKIGQTAGMTQEYADSIKKQFLATYEMKANTPVPLTF